ncbi:MAG: methionine adenosyltransferase [Erysipelotrichaceae bacterium]|nr:methionine adenosyltransferase [Erysipelotrichaceae bacterium]
MKNYIFTSESVTAGHPDKICDYIADSILDEALSDDPNAKMAVEATIKDDLIFIYGEANTTAHLDYKSIALRCMKEIGYHEDYRVLTRVSKQSMEINHAVEKNQVICAGDQGIMFGYATDETEAYMPAPIYYANKLAKRLGDLQHQSSMLGPDGKTQVSVEYENDQVKRIDSIVVSTMHKEYVTTNELGKLIKDEVIDQVIPNELIDENTKFYINPSGSFVVGGSFGDSGTTGRKIVCDSYGGMGRIGGGCFSSKDPSKVDRTGAYYCRYVAKNIVANGYAEKCEIQVSYAIGQEDPLSICVNTFNTGNEEEIYRVIDKNFSFKVNDMINELDLRKPIYKNTATYGHFGRNEFSWEKIKEI